MAYIGSQPTKVVSQQSSRVYRYTATAGQTAFSGADVDNQVLNVTPSDVEVHMNGLLLDPTDYTATSSSVTLGTAANAGDELTVTGMVTFEVADTYNKATADARYVDVAGDTMTGALALPSGGFTVGTDQLAVDSSGRVTMADQPAWFATAPLSVGWFTSAVGGVIPLAAVPLNTGNNYSTSGSKFTAPVSGVYQVNIMCYMQTSSQLCIKINGSDYVPTGGDTAFLLFTNNSGNHEMASASGTIYLNAGDYIQLAARINQTVYIYVPHTSFSGHLIG